MKKAIRIEGIKCILRMFFSNYMQILQFLDEKDYFSAPASATFHGNYEGGLCDHSRDMTLELVELTKKNGLEWQKARSPYVVGLFHDLCKMDEYEKTNGVYQKKKDLILSGHGDKSVMIASQFMTLTEEEILCIRYHMGAFKPEDANAYSNAVKKYPNILWTHQADMITSQIKGV